MMGFDDELRDQLHATGDELHIDTPQIDAVRARGDQRQRRTRIGTAAASLILLAGGVFGIVALTDDGGDEANTYVVQPDKTETTNNIDASEPAEVTQLDDPDNETGESKIVPWGDTFISVGFSEGSAMILDEDGAWTDIEASMPAIGDRTVDTMSSDGEHLVVIVRGNAEGEPSTDNSTVSITTDLQTWETQTLPRPNLHSPYIREDPLVSEVVVGPIGWSAVYDMWQPSMTDDLERIGTDYVDATERISGGRVNELGITFRVTSAAASEEAVSEDGDMHAQGIWEWESVPSTKALEPDEVFLSWEELPIEYADTIERSYSVGARYGEAPALGNQTRQPDTVATDQGFLRVNKWFATDAQASDPALQFSVDGANYNAIAGPAGVDDEAIVTVGSLGDLTLLITQDALYTGDAAGQGWEETQLPDTADPFTYSPFLGAAIADAGTAQFDQAWAEMFPFEIEKDGYRLVTDVDGVELFEIESGDLVAVYTGISLAEFVNADAGGFDLTEPDTGKVLVSIAAEDLAPLLEALAQARSENGAPDSTQTWRLVATTDAVTWWVQDIEAGAEQFPVVVNDRSVLTRPATPYLSEPLGYYNLYSFD